MARLAWAVTLGLCASACSSEATDTGDKPDGGSGGMPTTTTTGGAGSGGAPGGMGGNAGDGGTAGSAGAGGEGGAPITWSEPPVHLEERCLGSVPIGTFAYFPIPDDTFGFTVSAHAPTPSQGIGVFQLRPVGSSSVINNYDVVGKTIDAFTHLGTVTAGNPLSDLASAWPMHFGDWSVEFGDDGTVGAVDVCVYARRSSDGLPHGGVLDVNVFLAPGTVGQGYIETVLANLFDDYYDLLDIGEGTVTFLSLDGDHTTIDTFAEYQEVLRSSEGVGPRPAVNVFVVGNFEDSIFGNAIGVAGGIPGSPMVHGTNASGVAYQPSGDEAYDAGVLAHEIGHLGGLFHTTELNLSSTDPLSDTDECADTGSPGSCPDADNVMFPLAIGGTIFTADQIRVLQGSALYRGRMTEGGPPGASLDDAAAAAAPSPAASAAIRATAARPPADDLERLLAGHWCGHGGDYRAFVGKRAPRERLLELARDDGAFDLVRARALAVLALRATPAERGDLVALAAEVLASPASGHAVLLVAVEILADEGRRAVLATHAPRLRADRALADRLARIGLSF